MWFKFPFIPLLLSIMTLSGFCQSSSAQAPLFDNLGTPHFPISTKIPLAKRFFNQGIVLYYGFEWGEAIRSFKEAARLDPQCGMCFWGIALATGSKMNAPQTGQEYQEARNALQKALALRNHARSDEQAYIRALARRFQHQPRKPANTTRHTDIFSCHSSPTNMDESTAAEKSDYAMAMKKLTENYPDDNNAKALYAYALIESGYWGVTPVNKPLVSRIIKTLESVLKKDKSHIGANHYYIHIIEATANPGKALASANRLRTLVPGSEHLIHMPTHIYFLTGRYHEAVESGLDATEVYKKYNESCLKQGFEPEINYLYFHNYHFLSAAAIMDGRKELALSAARHILKPPFSSWLQNDAKLQWFIPIPLFVEARFAMWKDILNEKKPMKKYQYASGMWHYGRGMAFIHSQNTRKALEESRALTRIITEGPSDATLGEKGILLLTIASHVLKASISDARGNESSVLANLKEAMKIQDNIGYHEPPDWYFPVSEALGNALLKWGHPEQAVILYKKNLAQFPDNGWALFGLAKSLRQSGKSEEAKKADKHFKSAWKDSDIQAPVL